MANIAQLRGHASGSVLFAAPARAGPWPPQCSLSLRCMCGGLPRQWNRDSTKIRLQRVLAAIRTTREDCIMSNVIEIAKAGITAYNDKDWSKAKELLAPDAVYDEKGTHRRI